MAAADRRDAGEPTVSIVDDELTARAAKGSTVEELIEDISDAFSRLETGSLDNTATLARAALRELVQRIAP